MHHSNSNLGLCLLENCIGDETKAPGFRAVGARFEGRYWRCGHFWSSFELQFAGYHVLVAGLAEGGAAFDALADGVDHQW